MLATPYQHFAVLQDDASLQRLADGHVQCSAADAWLSSLTPAVTDVERSFMCGDPSTQAQKQRSQHALLVPHTDTVSNCTDHTPYPLQFLSIFGKHSQQHMLETSEQRQGQNKCWARLVATKSRCNA